MVHFLDNVVDLNSAVNKSGMDVVFGEHASEYLAIVLGLSITGLLAMDSSWWKPRSLCSPRASVR